MKRRIIIGLSAIFLVVLLGGGLVANFMTKQQELMTARRLVDDADDTLNEIHLSILQATQRLDAVRGGRADLRTLVLEVEAIRGGLFGLSRGLETETIASDACRLCHADALELAKDLHRSLVALESGFADLTMISSLVLTAGPSMKLDKVYPELETQLRLVGHRVEDLHLVLNPMNTHIDEEVMRWHDRTNRVHDGIIVVTVLLVLVGVVVTVSAVARPIRLLMNGTQSIVKGDYGFRIRMEGGDEMALLAERFNHMAEVLANRERRLQQKKADLQELNDDLERRVRERTRALRDKQDELNRKFLEVEAANEELQASYVQLQSTTAELEEAQARLQDQNDALQALNQDLRRANEVKNKFLSIMSHELRTPLTVINGYLSLVLDKNYGSPSRELRDILSVVKEQGLNQLGLIEDLLDLTRIESGEFRLHRQELEPATLLQKVLENFRPRLEEKGVAFTLEASASLPQVHWDAQKVLQVLQNLLDNALKFTPSGGWIMISAVAKSDFVEMRVSDNGIGIPRDHLERIFDRFYQVDSSPTRRYGGAGLGLSIVREIVQAHGGMIFVESEEGAGTTFQILLPVGEPDRALRLPAHGETEEQQELLRPSPRGEGQTILIVDDDESFLQMMKTILPKDGFRVRTTSDPSRVESLVRNQQVDLVILDLMMPDLDGYEVCRRIRAQKDSSQLPVLVVSASGGQEVGERVRQAGADDYVIKPFRHADLLERIAHLLEGHGREGVPVGGAAGGDGPDGERA